MEIDITERASKKVKRDTEILEDTEILKGFDLKKHHIKMRKRKKINNISRKIAEILGKDWFILSFKTKEERKKYIPYEEYINGIKAKLESIPKFEKTMEQSKTLSKFLNHILYPNIDVLTKEDYIAITYDSKALLYKLVKGKFGTINLNYKTILKWDENTSFDLLMQQKSDCLEEMYNEILKVYKLFMLYEDDKCEVDNEKVYKVFMSYIDNKYEVGIEKVDLDIEKIDLGFVMVNVLYYEKEESLVTQCFSYLGEQVEKKDELFKCALYIYQLYDKYCEVNQMDIDKIDKLQCFMDRSFGYLTNYEHLCSKRFPSGFQSWLEWTEINK